MVEAIKVTSERISMGPVADRIEARITAEGLEGTCIGIAIGAKVELFGPSFLGIEMPEKEHEETGKFLNFLIAGLLPAARLIKDRRGFHFRAWIGIALLQPMVGKTAALIVKILVTLA